jgi:hypothetical protein
VKCIAGASYGHAAAASVEVKVSQVHQCHAGLRHGFGAGASGSASCAVRGAAGLGFAAAAGVHSAVPAAAGSAHGYAAAATAGTRLHASASTGYGYGAEAFAVRLHDPFFEWGEGVGYRVVRADQKANGLEQGGIKRDALMGAVQRMGL